MSPIHGSMVDVMIELIQRFRSDIHGELSDRGRVMDALLDLRAAAADRPDLIVRIDHYLAELPGLTVLENSWWLGVLDDLSVHIPAPALS